MYVVRGEKGKHSGGSKEPLLGICSPSYSTNVIHATWENRQLYHSAHPAPCQCPSRGYILNPPLPTGIFSSVDQHDIILSWWSRTKKKNTARAFLVSGYSEVVDSCPMGLSGWVALFVPFYVGCWAVSFVPENGGSCIAGQEAHVRGGAYNSYWEPNGEVVMCQDVMTHFSEQAGTRKQASPIQRHLLAVSSHGWIRPTLIRTPVSEHRATCNKITCSCRLRQRM